MAFTGETINQSQNSTENNEMQKAIEKKQKEIVDINERFQVLMQESGVVFEIITPDGTIKYISETSEKVIKYKPEKLIGEKIYQFYEGEELKKLTRMVNFVRSDYDKKIQAVLTFKTKSQKNVYLEVSIQNLINNPVIQGIVLNFRDVTKRVTIEKRMSHIATHDDLTGLPNRSYFRNELAVQCKLAKKNEVLLAVMMLDFEGLKYINDALSFHSGDEMIIQMMIRLKVILGDGNFISRYSEDHFAIILKNSINLEAYDAIAQSIVVLFSRAFKVDIYEFDVTINMGISVFSKEYQNEEKADNEEKDRESELLIKHANMALLWSKREGKNRHKFYSSDISVKNYKQFELRTDLRKAIQKKQFEVYYQPVIKLKTTEILAAEALIRWNHPDWGMVSPKEFIFLAEETGVIIEMGKWMLREVCGNYKKWQQQGFKQISITVNFSSIQFYEKNFVQNIKNILNEFELDPKFLIIELTESLLIEDSQKAIHDIQSLQSLGLKVALDDFGTGFSSLSFLNAFNIDVLKMDGSFLKNIFTDKTTAIIARTIVRLARELNIKLVALRIENWEQLSFLREVNCYAGQGYLYSRPLPLEDFEKILDRGKCKPVFANNTSIKPIVERREFFRLAFYQLLKADLTILKIKEKKMNVGNTIILIKNIGPGGLCFNSNIKFPVEREFTLQFATTLLGKKIQAYGSLVWSEELEDNLYEYGVKFSIDENEREKLMKTLYEIQIKIKKNILYEDANFTPDSPFVFFKKMSIR
ncbi:MAG: EAL domain-containing protein [Acetobacterium sp.]